MEYGWYFHIAYTGFLLFLAAAVGFGWVEL